MKYKEFIQLTEDEKRSHCDLLLMLDNENLRHDTSIMQSMIKFIRDNADIVVLIKLALQMPIVDEIFKNNKLNDHWETIWRKCDARNDYSPVHVFDLVKGIYLYWSYLEENKNNDADALEFLQIAAGLGCRPAREALANYSLASLYTLPLVYFNDRNEEKAVCTASFTSSVYPVK